MHFGYFMVNGKVAIFELGLECFVCSRIFLWQFVQAVGALENKSVHGLKNAAHKNGLKIK